MGWIAFDQRLNEDKLFFILGKILMLCQHFELTSKNLVMWLCLAKSLHAKKFGFLSDEHNDYVEMLLKTPLGGGIKKLGALPEDFETLKEAKDARNYFCHESLLPLIYAPYDNVYTFNPSWPIIREYAKKLAAGDYLVSRWSYEFHENESGAFKIGKEYISTIEEWIFPSRNKRMSKRAGQFKGDRPAGRQILA